MFNVALNEIKKYFPSFEVSMVSKLYQQIVSGVNYRVFFTLRGSFDSYEIKIYVPLVGSNERA